MYLVSLAGLPPSAFPETLEALRVAKKAATAVGGGGYDSVFASHPKFSDRQEALRKFLQEDGSLLHVVAAGPRAEPQMDASTGDPTAVGGASAACDAAAGGHASDSTVAGRCDSGNGSGTAWDGDDGNEGSAGKQVANEMPVRLELNTLGLLSFHGRRPGAVHDGAADAMHILRARPLLRALCRRASGCHLILHAAPSSIAAAASSMYFEWHPRVRALAGAAACSRQRHRGGGGVGALLVRPRV
jgi:hypothetical protein